MLFHLELKGKDNAVHYVHGYDLLTVLDEFTTAQFKASKAPSGGNGTEAEPYNEMKTFSDWAFLGKAGESKKTRYYSIGGRTIKKDGKNYTSDLGIFNGNAAGGKREYRGKFGREEGPSYREYRKYVEQLNDEVHPHRELARLCRDMLMNNPPPLPPRDDQELKVSAFKVIPVLTATMFVSETIRNNRSLAVNLMLLDLIQSGASYGLDNKEYSLAKAIWRVDEPEDHFGNTEPLPRPKIDNYGEVIATTKGELHKWGGRGAMTQTDAVEQAKVRLTPTQTGIDNLRAQHPDKVGPLRPILTLAQQKEVSIMLNWLKLKGGSWTPCDASVGLRNNPDAQPRFLPLNVVKSVSERAMLKKMDQPDQLAAALLVEIRRLLEVRTSSLKL